MDFACRFQIVGLHLQPKRLECGTTLRLEQEQIVEQLAWKMYRVLSLEIYLT